MPGTPVPIFCCYAPADEASYSELKKHLGLLLHQDRIRLWHQGDIPAGADRTTAINDARANAQILLLLISADFFACQQCMDHELPQAMARHYARTAQVIPILLKPADWQSTPLGSLQVLPMNQQPISAWPDREVAWQEVVKDLIRAIDTPSQAARGEAGPPPGSSLSPVWTVPYQRNPVFTGREELLARLAQQLRTGQPTALSQPQAISGLGGIGKTQLAVEYAYRHAADYQAVLWARAESHEALIASFVDLAAALQLPQQHAQESQIAVNAVKIWLRTHTGWLLILDNADDLSVLPPFLPPAHSGHVLLTTREHALRRLAQRIEIDTLTPEVGALFLLHRAGRLAIEDSLEQVSPAEQDTAKQISRELGGLPLALDQAGAYLEETGSSLSAYLRLYQQLRAELLGDRRDLLSEHPDSVATTVSLAVQRVQKRQPAAAELLYLCAILAPDAIPEELLTHGAEHLGPTLGPVATDPSRLNQALSALLSASLITRDPVESTLSVHRLVQTVLRDAMSPEETQQWAERAILATNAAFPEVEFATWPACKRCLPHAQACFPLIEQDLVATSEAAALLNKLGRYLQDRGQYEEAEAPLLHALLIRERQLGPEHLNTAQSQNNLAELYRSQGKYEQAEPLYVRALTIAEEQLGAQHPDTAAPLNNLALLYWEQGKYERAEPLLKRVLTICEAQLGPQHPETATSLNSLALLYCSQGKYEQAEPLYMRALAIREAQLGPQHPDMANSLNNLASVYWEQGRYEQAEPLYMRALAICEAQLGAQHPNTALSLNNLASLYQRQGKYEQAEPLLKRVLTICEAHLGTEHPNTAMSVWWLAVLYQQQGKYEQAEPLYQRALAVFEQRLGLRHPHTRGVRGNYVELLRRLGRDEAAARVEARGVEM